MPNFLLLPCVVRTALQSDDPLAYHVRTAAPGREPHGPASSAERRRAFVEQCLAGPVTQSKLYTIKWSDVVSKGGSAILQRYSGSPSLLVQTEWPDLHWLPWAFKLTPAGFWVDLSKLVLNGDPIAEAALRTYVEGAVAEAFGVGPPAQWPQALAVSHPSADTHIRRLHHFGGISAVISRLYPELQSASKGPSPSGVELSTLPLGYWESPANRRVFVEYLIAKLGGTDRAYEATKADIVALGGLPLLLRHDSDVLSMFMKEYPEYEWKMWRFTKSPAGFWKKLAQDFKDGRQATPRAVLGEFVAALERRYDIEQPAQWIELLKAKKRSRLGRVEKKLCHFGGLRAVLALVYPTLQFPVAGPKASQRPLKRTIAVSNSQQFSTPQSRWEFLYRELQPTSSLESLYTATRSTFRSHKGSALLNAYDSSPAKAIMSELPYHHWQPWRFSLSTRGWWQALAAGFHLRDPIALAVARHYLEVELAPQFNISALSDWKNVTSINSTNEHYRSLQLGPIPSILAVLFPNELPLAASGDNAPRGGGTRLNVSEDVAKDADYWAKSENRAVYLEALKRSLGGRMEDLYKLTRHHFTDTGGAGLLTRHNQSIIQTLQAQFPDHKWQIWRFEATSRNKRYWVSLEKRINAGKDASAEREVREIVETLAAEHSIQTLDDWNRLSASRMGPKLARALRHLGKLPILLKRIFPEHDWATKGPTMEAKRTEQLAVRNAMKTMFPNQEVAEEWKIQNSN